MGFAFRRLLPYVMRYRGRFLLGLICVVLTTAITLLSPWVLKHAIDDLTREVTRGKLAFYAGLMLAIAVAGGVFRFLMRRLLVGASRDIEYDIRNDFFARLERLHLQYFHEHRTGDLMSRATNDLNAVRMMIGPAVMYSANTLIVFVVAVIVMFSIDARLTLIALVPLPFVSISVKYFGAVIHRRFEQIQEQLSNVSAVVQEVLAGVRVVRAYGQETPEIERFRAANTEYLRLNRALIFLQGFFFPSMTLFLGLGSLLVLWLGARHVISGRLTLGEFVAFNGYLLMLSWPMIAFGWVTNMLQRGFASWKRMLHVMDAEPRITDAAALAVSGVRGDISIRNLTFAYDGRAVLQDVSVDVKAGQMLAIVGATGSGKSTLVNLLPRLHEPPSGTVFIDGIDVTTIPLETLRRSIGVVQQDPFLFSDTIAHNIAFGVRGPQVPGFSGPAGREMVDRAAAISRLDKDVESFPKGLDTMVGERGITLSGGQKQRTAIARAVAIDPPILILDDALSAVDTYTEEEILTRLRSVMRQRTSIIVSHRISTVRDADLIVVLAEGRIVERGRHDELIARGRLYAQLHQKQLLEEELAEA